MANMDQDNHRLSDEVIASGLFPKNSLIFTATAAKNELSHMMDMAATGRRVVITRHKTPKAVLISVDEYAELVEDARKEDSRKLEAMRKRYDALVASMQTPESQGRMDDFFQATPEQLGEAAVEAAGQ